jgi:hypothetical protein
MGKFRSEYKAVLDALLLDYPHVRRGQMFGFPAYYAGRKMCICLYEDGVGVKLPQQTVARLLETDPNTSPFQPLGRARMREWIQINVNQADDYQNYRAVFEEALAYSLSLQ